MPVKDHSDGLRGKHVSDKRSYEIAALMGQQLRQDAHQL
jgi:hypothetical protein